MRKLKFVIGDLAVVNSKGRRDLRGRVGVVLQIGPTKGEYGVEFTDGCTPSLAFMEAMMLDAILNRAAQAVITTARTQLLRTAGSCATSGARVGTI
jgi:hypothetical protein